MNKSKLNYKIYFLISYLFCLYGCTSTHQEENTSRGLTETEQLIKGIYSKYPEFYPKVFDLDSSNKQTYFYNIFKEVKFVKDLQDSFSYKIFKGSDGSIGRDYKIVILTFRGRNYVIPIDIETGEGIQMLNSAFTPIWVSINRSQKRKRDILIIDKIIRDCLDFTPTTPFLLSKLTKPVWTDTPTEEKIIVIKERKAFESFINQINDSVFHFKNEDAFTLNLNGKYLTYFDEFEQVFIVSLDIEKIQFKFYNPLNIRHLYY
jgi:hypothetical protein